MNFPKHERFAYSLDPRWDQKFKLDTGVSLPLQMDIEKHARQRELLNPAFRGDYVNNLVPLFASKGADMAALLAKSDGAPVELQVRQEVFVCFLLEGKSSIYADSI